MFKYFSLDTPKRGDSITIFFECHDIGETTVAGRTVSPIGEYEELVTSEGIILRRYQDEKWRAYFNRKEISSENYLLAEIEKTSDQNNPTELIEKANDRIAVYFVVARLYAYREQVVMPQKETPEETQDQAFIKLNGTVFEKITEELCDEHELILSYPQIMEAVEIFLKPLAE